MDGARVAAHGPMVCAVDWVKSRHVHLLNLAEAMHTFDDDGPVLNDCGCLQECPVLLAFHIETESLPMEACTQFALSM